MALPIPLQNAVLHTHVVSAALLGGLLLSSRPQIDTSLSPARTQELKGVAILAVIFAHIGYYLVNDTRFLFPLSTIAGIVLNTFLFLSGYGLVKRFSAHAIAPLQLYRDRLFKKLWIPFLIALGVAILWHTLWGSTFSINELLLSVFGLFPAADIYQSLNSPLWYFTLITLYYLAFPVLFVPKRSTASSILMLVLSGVLSLAPLPFLSPGVDRLYRLHLLAFPLGMLSASITWPKHVLQRSAVRWGLACISIAVFLYAASHAHIGESIALEARSGLIGMAALVLVFLTKPLEFRLFSLFGAYSYEIYLLHWPLLLHDAWLFPHLPASISLILWLALLLGVGFLLQTTSKLLQKRWKSIAEVTQTR